MRALFNFGSLGHQMQFGKLASLEVVWGHCSIRIWNSGICDRPFLDEIANGALRFFIEYSPAIPTR